MNALTILKRGTAVAALTAMALALPSMAAGQDRQTQSAQERIAQATGEKKAPANETGIVTEGKQGTQSGDAPDQAASDDEAPANETGIVTEGKEGTQSGDAPDQAATGDQRGMGDAKAGHGQDMLVAKVGEREIRQSDVLAAIGQLPPELQQQPPEMVIPIAIDQLVMRELILQKAKEAGLESDPDVGSLAKDTSQQARDDAMVRVWLDKELGQAVTDQKVEETYDAVKQQMGDDAPSMEALRPQIEQELRQQAFLDLSEELQADAEITVYGPDGQAITQ